MVTPSDNSKDPDLALKAARMVLVEGLSRKEVVKALDGVNSPTQVTRLIDKARGLGLVRVEARPEGEDTAWPVNAELSARMTQMLQDVSVTCVDFPTEEKTWEVLERGGDEDKVKGDLHFTDDILTMVLARAGAEMISRQPLGSRPLHIGVSGGRTTWVFAGSLARLMGGLAPAEHTNVWVLPLAGEIGAAAWSKAYTHPSLAMAPACDASSAAVQVASAYRATQAPLVVVPGIVAQAHAAVPHLKALREALDTPRPTEGSRDSIKVAALEEGANTLAITGLGRLALGHKYMSADRQLPVAQADTLGPKMADLRNHIGDLKAEDPILDSPSESRGTLRERLPQGYEVMPVGDCLNLLYPLCEPSEISKKALASLRSINECTVSLPISYLAGFKRVLVIAGGCWKYASLRMFLRFRSDGKRLLSNLVTDSDTARALLCDAQEGNLKPVEVNDAVPGLKEIRERFDSIRVE